MRLQLDRLARPALIAATAILLFGLLNERLFGWYRWWFDGRSLGVLAGAAIVGLVGRSLHARGRVRAASLLGLAVMAGAIALAAYRVDAWSWIHVVTDVVATAGPLGVALYTLGSRRDMAGFAVGAAVVVASWHSWPALVLLGFVVGRGSRGAETTARHALSQVGAGVLAMLMASAVGFELIVWVRDTFSADAAWLEAHLDGPGSYVPRLAVESLLAAACLGHARGRSWGALALLVLAPTLFVLLVRTCPLPSLGGGCLFVPHPLHAIPFGKAGVFGLAVALAVLPWMGPIARAIRSTSATRT